MCLIDLLTPKSYNFMTLTKSLQPPSYILNVQSLRTVQLSTIHLVTSTTWMQTFKCFTIAWWRETNFSGRIHIIYQNLCFLIWYFPNTYENILLNPARVGLFLATYGWGWGGVDSTPRPLAKISNNDAIHLKLGTLILWYKRNKMVEKNFLKWLPFPDDVIKKMASRDFLW